MKLTHLSALRQASPGSPSLREVARRMKVSPEAISIFENGRVSLGPARIKLYAKAIGANEDVVRKMFDLSALRYHRERVAEITQRIKGDLGKARPSRVLQTA